MQKMMPFVKTVLVCSHASLLRRRFPPKCKERWSIHKQMMLLVTISVSRGDLTLSLQLNLIAATATDTASTRHAAMKQEIAMPATVARDVEPRSPLHLTEINRKSGFH